jgi:hypothetical protein
MLYGIQLCLCSLWRICLSLPAVTIKTTLSGILATLVGCSITASELVILSCCVPQPVTVTH